jgi:arylsulfatase
MSSPTPNIVLIMSDQHRADVMGCAGDPVVQTPHLDRLAAQGLRFENVSCQGPLCMPARASLLTERYVRDHGVFENRWDTPTTLPSFVADVAQAGYHTACIGKMHLWVHGDGTRDTREREPQMHQYGFTEPIETVGKLASVVVGSEYGDYLTEHGLYDIYREWTAARIYRPTTRDGTAVEPVPLSTAASNPVSGEHYIDAWHGRRVVQWIEEYDRPEPFFLWVGFPGPHDPWDAPADYVDRYRGRDMPLPGSLERPTLPEAGRFRQFLQYFLMVHSDTRNLTDAAIAEIRRYYFANVTLIDEAIGGIVGALERRGLLEGTWVIYTSDHGEMMGEHRMLTKMVFYDPAVSVPLVIRPPQGCAPRVVPGLVEHVDLSATIRDIAGSAGDPAFEGRSLLPWLEADGPARPVVYSENFGLVMARTSRYKLVVLEDSLEPVQLFDLAADPLEESNVVHAGEYRATLDDLMEAYVAPFLAPGATRPGPGIFDRLGEGRR